jgi:predicted nucleic acid-binding protein
LQRSPFFQDAELLFQAIELGQVVGYVTATTLTDIFYITRRHTHSIEKARQSVAETLNTMDICPVNRAVLESAFGSSLVDFEDAVQIACAVAQGLDAILTRDRTRFFDFACSCFLSSRVVATIKAVLTFTTTLYLKYYA